MEILLAIANRQKSNSGMVKYYLGVAYFWLYMMQLQETQAEAEVGFFNPFGLYFNF